MVEIKQMDGKVLVDPRKQSSDNVHHPNHYQGKYGLEVIDVIRNFTEGMSEEVSYYQGNCIKYLLRWHKKNGLEDLKKCNQYLSWLIEYEESKNG